MQILEGIKKNMNVLLLNPPISDTIEVEEMDMLTCEEPFGLLRLGTYFREMKCKVEYLDCLRDKALNNELRRYIIKSLPCGNYKEGIRKDIWHFGLEPETLKIRLKDYDRPDIIALSSIFTWHAEALRETLKICKEVYPKAKIILGGNFPTLCPDEASKLPVDRIFTGHIDGAQFLPTAVDLRTVWTDVDYLSMIKGCPHKCNYCVTNVLNRGKVLARPPDQVFREMLDKIKNYKIRCFRFYDDFILYRYKEYLFPFLNMVIEEDLGITLEFPLGFSAEMITEQLAQLLSGAGVEVVSIALETISEQRSRYMNRPHHIQDFLSAVSILKEYGFKGKRLRVFFLIGLPDQTMDEILKGILFLYSLDLMPCLTTYAIAPKSIDMAIYGNRIRWSSLDELNPYLWRFAHEGMRVQDLDRVYRYFHEKYYPLQRIEDSQTDDPIIVKMQNLIRTKAYLPQNWRV